MASPGNQHCADCNGTLSFPMRFVTIWVWSHAAIQLLWYVSAVTFCIKVRLQRLILIGAIGLPAFTHLAYSAGNEKCQFTKQRNIKKTYI